MNKTFVGASLLLGTTIFSAYTECDPVGTATLTAFHVVNSVAFSVFQESKWIGAAICAASIYGLAVVIFIDDQEDIPSTIVEFSLISGILLCVEYALLRLASRKIT